MTTERPRDPFLVLNDERARVHVPPHIRHTDVQILDALLRIEELMQKLVAAGAVRVDDEIQIDMSSTEQAKLIDELTEVTKPAPKRKNTRQL